MINTSKHIEDAIKFLNNQDVETLNLQFKYQEDYFNSEDYNYTLKNIEYNLNTLYEKARVLQDVIAYTKEYVKQNIYEITDECKSILNDIEDNVDSLKQSNYITLNVSFLESTGSYLDRDSRTLPKNAIYDGTITLSGKEKETLKIKTVSQANNYKPYNSNITNLITNQPYRSFYMLDAPISNGLKEEISVEFEVENIINQLNIVTSNCKTSDVRYIDASGTVDYIQEHANVIQNSRNTKSIKFYTTTDAYKKLTYYVDQARLKPTFWESIMENEYNKLATGVDKLTQSQIDELAGINAFKAEYKAYTEAIEAWLQRRKAVVDTNVANGYSDSVPEVQLVVAPTEITGTVNTLGTSSTAKIGAQEIYPDSERYRFEVSNVNNNKLVDKTGETVSYYTSLQAPKSYVASYQTK